MPLAIVGMACRFPGGVSSPEKLWEFVSEGRSAWSNIPASRFNQEAFHHPQADKAATTHIKGGYFLEEDVGLFDLSFFNFTADVAAAMDPQIRLQLELTFEALESAGIPLHKLAGSNTAVYSGAFTKDYHDRQLTDPLRVPRAFITGNSAAMLANRVSHFFDLKGPSTAVDTACSTSLVGLHLACQSLRSGESDCAIVGGACINLNPDFFANLSSLGSCGRDGKCYAFDHRAQGYGRGEGVATLVVKRLDDALRDGDPIRVVVRETAVNQDGKTATITSPDCDAQLTLIEACYERAGLDPLDTAVVEAHGTGTKAGDPIEATATGRAISQKRPADKPVYLASVKTNLGHTEAASGLAAVIKMAKSLEHGQIAPSINFEKHNPDIDFDGLRLKIPRKLEAWPAEGPRRASVNNFGYGGTNAHVILEEASLYLEQSRVMINGAATTRDQHRKLVLLSARDEPTVKKMKANLRDHLRQASDTPFGNLAYTLSERRSRFNWTLAVSAQSVANLIDVLSDDTLEAVQAQADVPRLGFVFNGQGAQWFAMGRELMTTYPVFMSTLEECDGYLKEIGADWSLVEELGRDEKASRVGEVRFSMPLSCVVQLALVRLLESWGVTPAAVTGHSSGEVAAAFAAGALNLREAIASTYFRGLVNAQHIEKNTSTGGMMAVGLGQADVEPYLSSVSFGKAVVACVNSSSSVTLSGDMVSIEELEEKFTSEGIFARKLKVQSAFHSHHMLPLEEKYRSALNQHMRQDGRRFKSGVLFSSPVTGGRIEDANKLGPEHWIENMIQPVHFAQSFRHMVVTESESGLTQNVDVVVEIGPHGALAGPIRQCLSEPALQKLSVAYGSCLDRGTDAVLTMQKLAGFLLQKGYPVNTAHVNLPHGHGGLRALAGLPSYPWNHSTRFWHESRMSHEHRFRPYPPHDLLGLRMPGTSDHSPIWRLILRTSGLPWVRDHVVQGNIVYPGSGYIAMVVEAMRQLHSSEDKTVAGYTLKDVEILRALIIPDNNDGVEVQLFLEPSNERSLVQGWRQFHIYSALMQGEWVETAKGLIAVDFTQAQKGSSPSLYTLKSTAELDIDASAVYPKKMAPRDFFKSLHGVGVAHGPSFQNLLEMRMAEDKAVTTFKIADSAATMPYHFQKSHVIHPITLDAVFQAAYPTLSPEGQKLVGASVPRSIKSLYISSAISSEAGHQLRQVSTLLKYNRQGFHVDAAVLSGTGMSAAPVIELEGVHFQSVGRAEEDEGSEKEKLVLVCDWYESFTLNDVTSLKETLKTSAPSDEKAIAQDLARAAYQFVHDALQRLTEEDIENLEWHHKTFYNWMLLLEQQAANNELAPESSSWVTASEGMKQTLFDKVAVSSVNGELGVRMGKNLVAVMRKEVAPLELMLKDQLLYKFYQHLLHFTRSTVQAGELVRAYARENPRARVLEIGAGTGGCTIPVLKALGDSENARFEHYDFTDISAGFFQAARDRLGAWGDLISYSTLDIEQDPEEQNFQLGSYDIIIAAQVLHATKNISHTMANVRRLLKDGGKLILVETTRDSPDMHLIFGCLPGWWLGEEPERKYSPNMPLESWGRILQSTGFSGLDVNVWDCEDETHQAMSCIMSTAVPVKEEPSFEREVTIVYADGKNPPSSEWVSELMESLVRLTGTTPALSDIATLGDVSGNVCIFLSGLNGMQVYDESTFKAVKALVTKCRGLLWITTGSAIDCTIPENAMHLGLLRTARVENAIKRYISLDLDPKDVYSTVSLDTITKIFVLTMDFSKATVNGGMDFEYAQRKSKILVPRFHPDAAENEEFFNNSDDKKAPEMQPFIQPNRSLRMYVDIPGLMDSIVFRDDPDARSSLPEGWVEIEPKAYGLNFRDVMTAMGQLNENSQEMGVECSGVITAVGPTTPESLKVGDRVCALTAHGHFANRVRVPWTSVARIPEHMSYETAASFVTVFVTAWYSLFDAGRAEEGERVLIHAASGGVGQACIILAQWNGLEVFATVSSQEKRDFLKATYGLDDAHIFSSRDPSFAGDVMAATGRKGVDVVINSLAGELLHESWWHVLAPHGRFVEIGKKDIHHNKALDMEPFRRALSFIHVDVVQLADNKGRVIQRILQEIIERLEDGTIRNISPVATYPLADIARAFRAMQAGKHIGKLVLVPSAQDVVKTAPQRKVAKLSPDATYLIVGGLTGIGQSIARYFLDHGAKNLLLVSRNAAARASSSQLGTELAATGATVAVKNCDVGNMGQLQSVLEECRAAGMPPVRGVVHGGMVLNDSILERMTYEQWCTAMNPKLNGTRNLDELFQDNVDFFIMLSSVSGVLGSTSQSNYAAGGTYQDALARNRASRGLPGVSIDLGIVNSVGFVAETEGVKERLVKSGHRPLEESEVLALVNYAICKPKREVRVAQCAAGIGGVGLGGGEPRFAALRKPVGSGSSSEGNRDKGGGGKEESLHEQITNAGSSRQAEEVVERAIVAKLAEMFVIPEADIDPAQPLTKYGVDSLVAVELRNWLVPRARIEISIFDLLSSSSLRELAGKVVKKSQAALAVA
ncbi:hypothetical protein QBC46DRAFT_291686 [Diplogelasinospora grovesii]|uniref:Polyketide synthase n=1 Tax=Diplogelasinospora grovesii TaxID=303347 RepID=A0AAN6N6Y3_9PEZI|nr:hypothetical protein QBC46DRAFT_291686 [Diplogelasinospora grovesii]